MVLINKAINEVTVKLVYYGPGLCGKTTNLERIYGNPKLENKGKMISMSTETDRTLFFDFMPMELGTIGGQKVRVQLYTVPGQVFYDASRKLILDNLKANLRLNRIDPAKIALVFQYNKRDLPNVDSVDDMNNYMQPNGVPVVEAAAINGTGVTATLRAAIGRILENLKKSVDTTLRDEPELAPPDMSALVSGTPKVSITTDPFAPVDVEEDPFGAAPAAGEELEALLAGAREVVASLEAALAKAREQERRLADKLAH